MKIRMNHDSLRLRLGPSDVAALQQTGRVSESVRFGNSSQFTYTLQTRRDASEIRAMVDGAAIIVEIPEGIAGKWTSSDDVGLSATQSTGEDHPLQILIEKDFQCLHPQAAQAQAGKDFYPNPHRPEIV